MIFLCLITNSVGGHLQLLQLAHEKQRAGTWHGEIWCAAAEHGHLELLKWLYSVGRRLDSIACARAAKANQLDVLEWAHSIGCHMDADACAEAAREGHMDLLKRMHEQKWCEWDPSTCNMAARGGHIEVNYLLCVCAVYIHI